MRPSDGAIVTTGQLLLSYNMLKVETRVKLWACDTWKCCALTVLKNLWTQKVTGKHKIQRMDDIRIEWDYLKKSQMDVQSSTNEY